MRMRALPNEEWVLRRVVPTDIAKDQELALNWEERRALQTAEMALVNDPAFEHLGDKVATAVWRFACQCAFDKKTDFVAALVREHFKEPESRVCYIPVEYLKVSGEHDFLGVKFLPLGSVEVTPSLAFVTAFPVGSIAAVTVSGTDPQRMADRARALAEHSLRVLRIALREHNSINDRQLRFRLGVSHSFGKDFTGWAIHPETAYELELSTELVDLASNQEVSALGPTPLTDIERKAHLAVRWMERSRFTADQLVALLFLFFALEALLGDKSEGLKAHALAFRQAMLSHVATDGFTNPNETLELYEQVRSAAVHGEDAPPVDEDTVQGLALTVRWTLAQYLRVARENGFTKRGQLLRFLKEHPDRAKLAEWLRSFGGPWWADYVELPGT